MRSSSKSRNRGRNANRRSNNGGSIINRVFDSAGPEGKVRGTPQQIIDKYTSLELSRIFLKQVYEKDWETDLKEKDISEFISRYVNLFDGNGGDISTLLDKCIIINVI